MPSLTSVFPRTPLQLLDTRHRSHDKPSRCLAAFLLPTISRTLKPPKTWLSWWWYCAVAKFSDIQRTGNVMRVWSCLNYFDIMMSTFMCIIPWWYTSLTIHLKTPKMKVWKMMFLFKQGDFQFPAVDFPWAFTPKGALHAKVVWEAGVRELRAVLPRVFFHVFFFYDITFDSYKKIWKRLDVTWNWLRRKTEIALVEKIGSWIESNLLYISLHGNFSQLLNCLNSGNMLTLLAKLLPVGWAQLASHHVLGKCWGLSNCGWYDQITPLNLTTPFTKKVEKALNPVQFFWGGLICC